MAERAHIRDVIKDLERILKIANHYSCLWEDGAPLYREILRFTSHFIAADEEWWMAVQDGEEGLFLRDRYHKNLSSEEAALALVNDGYIGEPGEIVKDFKTNLEIPLGKYLAKKELSQLEM